MALLALFAPAEGPEGRRRVRWSLADLSRATGLDKSVVLRLMATMAEHGFVLQDPATKTYGIGPTAFAVGNAYDPVAMLGPAARPVMEALTERCGHASYLGVRVGNRYQFVLAVESIRSVRVTIDVGELRHLHTGAIGKALLADLGDEEIRDLVGPDPLPRMTERTIERLDDLLADLAEVRRRGVARNRQEAIVGVGSVAVPVRDALGQVIAGLGIVFPSHIVSGTESEQLAATVAEAGREIERRLGRQQGAASAAETEPAGMPARGA